MHCHWASVSSGMQTCCFPGPEAPDLCCLLSSGPMAPPLGTSLGDVLSLSYPLPRGSNTFLPGNPSLGVMVLVGFYLSGLKHLNCFGKCQGEGYFLRCRFVLTRNRIGNCFPGTSLGTVQTGTGAYVCSKISGHCQIWKAEPRKDLSSWGPGWSSAVS